MPSLYKKPIFGVDPVTGQKTKEKSAKWWGRYRDALGRDRRVPLARDKAAAQAMLKELVLRAEREAAGIADPLEKHSLRPLAEHLDAFERHQTNKGNTAQHIGEVITKVRKCVKHCEWKYLRDITSGDVQDFLAFLRKEEDLSIQTSNHYLRALKQFSRWLVRDRRAATDPLIYLSMLNPKVDRRHERRALSAEEFSRLVEVAETGGSIELVSGPDRAIIYVLAAWTGYRKAEIGSLTRRSFHLDQDPPTAVVEAAYSKRRRQDEQVLHPELARRIRLWLETKPDLGPDDALFPISYKATGVTEKDTAKMMKLDLRAAREQWLKEKQGEERKKREESDFLKYRDSLGRYADFHSNRHTFITSLERAGVSPRTAQTLARHSDIRLTMGIYTHIGRDDQTAAIRALPAPPEQKGKQDANDISGGESNVA